MAVIRVNFVGQQDIADDLTLGFAKDKEKWAIAYATTGAEALNQMDSNGCDAVVTELQLPDMTASELLRKIQDLYPSAARLVLSEAGDRRAMIGSLGSAHQILSKPCNTDTLKGQISKSLSMRLVLNDDNLHARIARIDKLPVLPSIYDQLVREMQSESASMQKIAALIRQDVAISARVLQMINSAYFGVSRHVDSVMQAVTLLGFDTVKSLVLTAGVFSQFKDSGLQGFLVDEIYNHSLAVGTNAQHYANAFGLSRGHSEEALTAGTLHDIGKLILVTNFESEVRQIISVMQESKLPLHEAERQVLGINHCEMGAHLLSLWGLSDHILEAVAFHDAPRGSADQAPNVLAAVHIANAFDHDQRMPDRDPRFTTADTDYLNQIGLGNQLKYLRAVSSAPQPARVN
jgi:putative nucleotidyltransferase with HDIG domain